MIKVETKGDHSEVHLGGDENELAIETMMVLTSVLKFYEKEERIDVAMSMMLTALRMTEDDTGLEKEVRVDDRFLDFLKGGE